jgi:hypothetical protein
MIQPSYGGRPYAVLTVSEFGVCKRWAWSGAQLDEESVFGEK